MTICVSDLAVCFMKLTCWQTKCWS